MDAMQALRTRRSIRRYTADPVGDHEVRGLLEAAMSAPSAGNQQPWEFVLLADKRLRDEIPRFHPYADMLREAPLAVLVCGNLQRESFKGYWVQDCSAATQNLLLAAHASGLGAVWVGVYPKEDRVRRLRELLGLPEHVVPFALVPLGRPAERPAPVQRFDPARMHVNRWGGTKNG
jgi:nitroreductase